MSYAKSVVLAAALAGVIAACGDGSGPDQTPQTATITGTVVNTSTDAPLVDATVSADGVQATTDANGEFDLAGVTVSTSVEIRSERLGFITKVDTIVVEEGTNSYDIRMARDSIHVLSNAAVFMPPAAPTIRGVILALGGADTRGLATGVCAIPDPAICESQRLTRNALLNVAYAHGLGVMGSIYLSDGAASDARVLAALDTVASRSDRPELAQAPLLIRGISAGGPEAYGFTLRRPGRVIGFMLAISDKPSSVRTPEAQSVPGYVLLAEFDSVVSNPDLISFFASNRAEGARWSFAIEPGATHDTTSNRSRSLTVGWMNAIVGLRLPPSTTPGAPVDLNPIAETSGWLGNLTTFAIAAYADYTDNPLEASWFPSQQTAQFWQGFVMPGGGPP
jgi:dienelactone hydrolase